MYDSLTHYLYITLCVLPPNVKSFIFLSVHFAVSTNVPDLVTLYVQGFITLLKKKNNSRNGKIVEGIIIY